MEIKSGRGYVYSIQYHIVWCVKYRHKVLTSDIEKDFYNILYKIAEDNTFEILECNGEADPIAYDFVDDIQYLVKAYKKRCSTYKKNGCYFVEEGAI